MKKVKFIIRKFGLFLITAILLLSSCSKVLVEEPTSFIAPSSYYNNSDQITSVLAGAMNVIKQGWVVGQSGLYTFVNDDQWNGGQLIIPQDYVTPEWNFTYKAIENINGAIEAMEAGKLNTTPIAQVNVLMGQAKFLRAFNYFMLVRMFGGVPLITENTINPATAKISRSSIDSVYSLIISDFTEAIATLPATWPTAQQGRPTRDAAKALLAKAYLTMATYPLNESQYYQKAADMAKQVIDSGVYHLEPDINNVFSYATQYSPEMMWSFNSNAADQAIDPKVWIGSPYGYGADVPDPRFVDGDSTYPAYPRQPRLYAYIQLYPSIPWSPWSTTDTTGLRFSETGSVPGTKKFMYDTQANFSSDISYVNQPIIRYADVLLMFAEADNMASGGPTQAAVDAINQVIDRANGYVANAQDPDATLNMSVNDFDAKVIQERSWELCFEFGDRWFDLVRKHMLNQVTRPLDQKNFSTDDYLFPIPSQDILLNPLLTQNPGY